MQSNLDFHELELYVTVNRTKPNGASTNTWAAHGLALRVALKKFGLMHWRSLVKTEREIGLGIS